SETSDRFLVLDVAAHRYPPVWVRSADLWAAVHTVDPASGRTRGFVIVREGRAHHALRAEPASP
ncbi:MAG TPA: phytochelatin synthase family protein, partial [Burkholderiaceae bacterium]|nr:phytochelatin synthase family protein [Burkholderiaceae bacterium]